LGGGVMDKALGQSYVRNASLMGEAKAMDKKRAIIHSP
jgi:hypothetical protein